mgnify:CR=1 FL=1
MITIKSIHARQILDSRGNPTIEVDLALNDGSFGRSSVPSGASTGTFEALELRDNSQKFLGKSVYKAINNINDTIANELVGQQFENYRDLDHTLIALDGSDNKKNLGANAILGVSLSYVHALSHHKHVPLHALLLENEPIMPVPMMNIINGGSHADNNIDIQEFMIVPLGANSIAEAIKMGCEIFNTLKSKLEEGGMSSSVGDEGGFAPNLPKNEEGLALLVQAIERAGYSPGDQMSIALDVAAQEFHHADGYHIDGRVIDGEALGEMYGSWIDEYPIVSIEDAFGEDDWVSWSRFTKQDGHRVQVVGDDLFVTNMGRLSEGIEMGAANAILIKPNQIGTVTETLECIEMAKEHGMGTVISHRSGETSDDTISDIAVGTRAGQIKTGAPARSDRTAKYNQLLRIAEECEEYTQLY